jgi:hypothetical protein
MMGLFVTVPASLVAITLALQSGDPAGPALAMGVAALGSCPRPVAFAWAVLAISLAMGQTVPAELNLVSLAAMLSLGLVCACLTRTLTGSRGMLATTHPTHLLLCFTVLSLALLWLPDSRALLETEGGEPLYFTALVQDTTEGIRFETAFRGSAAVSIVGGATKFGMSVLAFTMAFFVLLGSLRDDSHLRWIGWVCGVVTGSCLLALGSAGQFGLIGNSIDLSSSLNQWDVLAELNSPGLVVDRVNTLSTGYLGWSSRPAVDMLRIVGGIVLAWTCFWQLRVRKNDHQDVVEEVRTVRLELFLAALFVLGAMTCLQHHGGVFYVLSAILLLTTSASFLGIFSSTSKFVPQALVLGALCLVLLATVGPAAGWILV